MSIAIIDIVSVGVVGFTAVGFLVRLGLKFCQNKPLNLCGACGNNGLCSKKNFSNNISSKSIIKLKEIV